MVTRHLGPGHDFFCVTDDPRGLAAGIEVIPLPGLQLEGWWNKLWLYSSDFPLQGTCLYLDLDIIICQDLAQILDFRQEQLFVSIPDYSGREEFNTSLKRWEAGAEALTLVWEKFCSFHASLQTSPAARIKRQLSHLRQKLYLKKSKRLAAASGLTSLGRYQGEQKWLSEQIWHQPWTSALPTGWCCSFKWGAARNRAEKRPKHQEGPHQDCWTPECRLVTFEGKPKPHQCLHLPFVKDNWG